MSSAHTFSRTSQSQRGRLRVPGVLAPPALERGYWVLPGKLRKSFSDRTMQRLGQKGHVARQVNAIRTQCFHGS